jgi:hypothetical protein
MSENRGLLALAQFVLAAFHDSPPQFSTFSSLSRRLPQNCLLHTLYLSCSSNLLVAESHIASWRSLITDIFPELPLVCDAPPTQELVFSQGKPRHSIIASASHPSMWTCCTHHLYEKLIAIRRPAEKHRQTTEVSVPIFWG